MSAPTPINKADATAGGKATNLRWLVEHEFATPEAWFIPPQADVPDVSQFVGSTGTYAVRSSASVEDGSERSFAGQFESVLGVEPTSEALLAAVETVRSSADSARVKAYDHGTPIDMAVIIQRFVEPVASGVAFSKNPVTGLSETVIEAVSGRGEDLVSGGVTPSRWVKRWGDYIEMPTDSPVDEGVIDEVALLTDEVASGYGQPADIEWVWDGNQVWLLQVRPITGLDSISIYSNRISREVMPGIIKPLVWSVNVPVVNRAWIELFGEVLGPNELTPDDLARQFGYRSYFNMGTIGEIFELMGMPRESLESLLGLPKGSEQPRFKPSGRTYRMTPKLIALAIRKSRYGKRADALVPDLHEEFRAFDVATADLDDEQLLDAINRLMELGTRAAYVNIVIPLLANLYSALLRKRLERRDVDLTEIDLTAGVEGFAELDPLPHLDDLAEHLDAPEAFDQEAQRFLDRFGHFSDSGNDFSVPTWREQPELIETLARARREGPKRRATRTWDDIRPNLGRFGRAPLGVLKKRTVSYQLRREHISSTYTYGYGLFRPYMLEIGRRLAERDIIESRDDVMYLTLDEVRIALRSGLDGARQIVTGHKEEIDRVAQLELPETIYGDDFVPVESGDQANVLRGVATSAGHHRGTIRVVSGLADFDKVKEGDILAIPFSDVGWTPLFARAGAVVAESGGMLSHSSIVAREYGIPCVVSVPGATRLTDGATATVDGYRGEITVE